MHTFLVIFQVLAAIALVGLILIQHGKGADAGAAFGSGASGTVFGSRGSANFLSRATAVLATVFFLTSLALAYLVHGQKESSSVVDKLAPTVEQPAIPEPVVPGSEGAAEPAAPVAPVVPE
jgi:preprotein translocase subunit SecG